MSTLHFIIIYLAIVNMTAFIMYGIDKWRAVRNRDSQGLRKSKKKQKRRIPESTLLWHHKTLHKKFKYGLPLILLVQIALVLGAIIKNI